MVVRARVHMHKQEHARTHLHVATPHSRVVYLCMRVLCLQAALHMPFIPIVHTHFLKIKYICVCVCRTYAIILICTIDKAHTQD